MSLWPVYRSQRVVRGTQRNNGPRPSYRLLERLADVMQWDGRIPASHSGYIAKVAGMCRLQKLGMSRQQSHARMESLSDDLPTEMGRVPCG
jgi:hypothetical protein